MSLLSVDSSELFPGYLLRVTRLALWFSDWPGEGLATFRGRILTNRRIGEKPINAWGLASPANRGCLDLEGIARSGAGRLLRLETADLDSWSCQSRTCTHRFLPRRSFRSSHRSSWCCPQ